MNDIAKAAKAHLATMSACAAIRQTAAEYIDVPRKELVEALVSIGLNVATVRTQIQRAKDIVSGRSPVPGSKAAAPLVTGKDAQKLAKGSKSKAAPAAAPTPADAPAFNIAQVVAEKDAKRNGGSIKPTPLARAGAAETPKSEAAVSTPGAAKKAAVKKAAAKKSSAKRK